MLNLECFKGKIKKNTQTNEFFKCINPKFSF